MRHGWSARRAAALTGAAVLVAGGAAARQAAPADAVARIVEAATTRGQSFAILQHLTDRIGPRLTGSAGAAEAVRWTAERLRADGLDTRLEPVLVPHWVRGEETAELTGALPRSLAVTALGGSVPTPPEGVTAQVVVVDGLEGLRALDDARVKGRIVLFNRAMGSEGFQGYRRAAEQRSRGASEAARRGAVAAIVRSVGTLSARLVHTGAVGYVEGLPRIPAAAVAAEDADLIARLAADGGAPPVVRLRLGCRSLPDTPSHNVVADLRGRERPDEVVLIGAHLDSWDLATGAHDDGAGVVMVMDALRILKTLGLVPRRTVRGVLFMNEENGLRGGRAYAADHAGELARHVAAIEADSGGFSPEGFSANVDEAGLEMLRGVAAALAPVGATRITAGGGGADIGPMRPARVPLMSLMVAADRYFHWHHTPADTLDKVDPGELARATAAMAAMAYLLAEMPETLPRPVPSPSPSPSAPPR